MAGGAPFAAMRVPHLLAIAALAAPLSAVAAEPLSAAEKTTLRIEAEMHAAASFEKDPRHAMETWRTMTFSKRAQQEMLKHLGISRPFTITPTEKGEGYLIHHPEVKYTSGKEKVVESEYKGTIQIASDGNSFKDFEFRPLITYTNRKDGSVTSAHGIELSTDVKRAAPYFWTGRSSARMQTFHMSDIEVLGEVILRDGSLEWTSSIQQGKGEYALKGETGQLLIAGKDIGKFSAQGKLTGVDLALIERMALVNHADNVRVAKGGNVREPDTAGYFYQLGKAGAQFVLDELVWTDEQGETTMSGTIGLRDAAKPQRDLVTLLPQLKVDLHVRMPFDSLSKKLHAIAAALDKDDDGSDLMASMILGRLVNAQFIKMDGKMASSHIQVEDGVVRLNGKVFTLGDEEPLKKKRSRRSH